MYDSLSTARQQHALEWAIALTRAPANDALPELATGPVEHILYCSRARHPFSEDQLADLFEQTRANNARCDITGLLCYSDGYFVHVLEGPTLEVERLYALIERDPRHHHVRLLSRGAGPLRRFPDWRVALTKAPQDFYWLTTCFEARLSQLLVPQIPILEPSLMTLLHIFSKTCTPPRPPAGMLGAAHWAARPILAAV